MTYAFIFDVCICVVCAYVCRSLGVLSSVFLSPTLPYILRQHLLLNLEPVIELD